jgi:hypothetical protein
MATVEVQEALAVPNGEGAELEANPLTSAPGEAQERLLFFAAVLIGHKVEVQVRGARGGRGRGRPGDRLGAQQPPSGWEAAPPRDALSRVHISRRRRSMAWCTRACSTA